MPKRTASSTRTAAGPQSATSSGTTFSLIKAVADNDGVELTSCSSEHDIKNPIEKTIYQEIYKVLKDLVDNRDAYEAEIKEQFENLEREYKLV